MKNSKQIRADLVWTLRLKHFMHSLNKKRRSQLNQFAPESNEINKYLASVFAAQIEPQKSRIQLNTVEGTIFISLTNAQEIAKVLKSLKNKKSSGDDGIANKILKNAQQI